MATDSDAAAGGRPGITFDVTLDVPWNAPEAVVCLHSDGVVELDLDTVSGCPGLYWSAAGSRCDSGSTGERCTVLDARLQTCGDISFGVVTVVAVPGVLVHGYKYISSNPN